MDKWAKGVEGDGVGDKLGDFHISRSWKSQWMISEFCSVGSFHKKGCLKSLDDYGTSFSRELCN